MKKTLIKIFVIGAVLFSSAQFTDAADLKANGVQCNDCVNECASKNYVTNTGVRTCAAANGQNSASATGSVGSTSANATGGTVNSANDKKYFTTKDECQKNCTGGSCSGPILSQYRCDISSASTTSGAAQTASGGLNSAGSVTILNPLQYDSVEGFLGAVLSGARQIIVVLALVFIVIGAIMYVISAGQSGMMETAKKTITMAMVGLAIGIAAPSFLKEISKILGWNSTDSSMSGALTLSQIAMNVLNFLLGIFGTLAIIMLLIGGIMYMTSAGDDNRIEAGKKIFKYSVIGIVLALASLVIVQQIAKLLA